MLARGVELCHWGPLVKDGGGGEGVARRRGRRAGLRGGRCGGRLCGHSGKEGGVSLERLGVEGWGAYDSVGFF